MPGAMSNTPATAAAPQQSADSPAFAFVRELAASLSHPPIGDVLACAALLSRWKDLPERLAPLLAASRAAQRLGLAKAAPEPMLADAASELATLNAALGR